MEKLIKQNWFKIGILVVIFLIGLMFYNWFYISRNQDLQTNCSKSTAIWHAGHIKDNSAGIGPEYSNHYSAKINKCFASTSNYLNEWDKGYIVSSFVWDVYENRLVLEKDISTNNNVPVQYSKYDTYSHSEKVTEKEFGELFKLYMED